MQNDMPPLEQVMREKPQKSLSANADSIKRLMRAPKNNDLVVREFRTLNRNAFIAFIDGICDSDEVAESVIKPCIIYNNTSGAPQDDDALIFVRDNVLFAAQTKDADTFSDIVREMLSGLCALFIDGCADTLVIDLRNMPHRAVGRTNNESVVLGSQEGFIENLRTNISLIRKNLRCAALVTEIIPVGSVDKLNAAIMYVDGVASDSAVSEAKRRLKAITRESVTGTGQIRQLIEDHPLSLFPQMLQTERPDRAAAGLSEGQFVILADNSPYALMAPSTMYHFLHASDDTFMRWQYGTFIRFIRMLGVMFSLLLPGTYIALTQFHSHLLPMNLLTSIAEARSNVPFPILGEILIMEFSFYLINEAGTRIPSQIGSALGIVGALILGQAAVAASIISPILIIIVALTGLGNFAVPSYDFSIAMEIYRLLVLLAGAFLGLYGVVLVCILILAKVCSMRSFGSPYCAPLSPWRPHNPDILIRMPIWFQKLPLFFANRRDEKGG